MKKIIIVGAGGFGREVEWLIKRINEVNPNTYKMIGYADDMKEKDSVIGHSKVICTTDELANYKEKVCVVIAIANATARKAISEKLTKNKNLSFPNIIDPAVIYDEDEVAMGKGNIICAGTIMTVNIKIDDFNIINLDCTIGHDAIFKNYVTLYPSVNISGFVTIEDETEIGTGTQIIQGLTIGGNTIIGASAVVVRNIEESGTYVGVPVKKIK